MDVEHVELRRGTPIPHVKKPFGWGYNWLSGSSFMNSGLEKLSPRSGELPVEVKLEAGLFLELGWVGASARPTCELPSTFRWVK